ncbi:OmpH family outer membrane protein [Verrucomicrobiota bacterium sgz303538]
MKHILILPLLIAALGFGAVSSASAQVGIKVGTVDMKKVFESYYKTKDAEARINEARNAAKKELEDRMDAYKKSTEEVQKLNEEIQKPELSQAAKEAKSKQRDEKIAELKTMEREVREFQATREKQLQEQSVRMRGGIVEEINKIVADRVKADQFDIVFDKSGPSLNGVPVILHAKDSYDFTADVITALNKNKGKESSEAAPAAAPAEQPAKATPAKKK